LKQAANAILTITKDLLLGNVKGSFYLELKENAFIRRLSSKQARS